MAAACMLLFLLICACISFGFSLGYFYTLQQMTYQEGALVIFARVARYILLIMTMFFLVWGILKRKWRT